MVETDTHAWGWGLVTKSSTGEVLDTWFPAPKLGQHSATDAEVAAPAALYEVPECDKLRNITRTVELVSCDLTAPIRQTQDAYLRLHLLSHLLVQPNSINLDGIFAALPNVVWTAAGPVSETDYRTNFAQLKAAGLTALGFDKFPRLTDYVLPAGVRIADTARVRLGAHLAPGTTVMHEGFVNFNAGTLGASMVEGRISQGVVVGDGSDIGGGASIMGTLSGGGTEKITVGERALLGANSGIGISIGDDTVVEAGLYVTAGTKVTVVSGGAEKTIKAVELSGQPNLLFRRNSESGRVEVLSRSGAGITLNEQLHA